jgi:transposase
MGYTDEAAGKLSKITVATGTDLSDNTAKILGTAAAFNVTNKVALNEKQIVEDVAKASAAVTVSLGMQPGKIAAAVVQAKALGLELEQVTGIAESLLNFESSISNELEAELLTGRALNLEQARYLALTNDIEGVAKEIANQGITAAEFGSMNMIQQKSIAEAVGLTKEELAQSLINQQALNKAGMTGKTTQEAYAALKGQGLSDDQIAIKLGDEYGVTERTMRKWFVKLDFKEKVDIEPEQYVKAKERKHDKSKKRFIITSAQSATPVNKKFIKNIEAYAEHINAEILVIPFRYKNPTSVFSSEQREGEWWDDSIIKYLTLNRHDLNKGIAVLSDVPIQPTASNPLLGLEGMTAGHSCVVGHPRLELKTIPVMEGCRPKIMFTTGACTKNNYTESKAGKKGEFHHSIGFAIVEIKDDETYYIDEGKLYIIK